MRISKEQIARAVLITCVISALQMAAYYVQGVWPCAGVLAGWIAATIYFVLVRRL